MHELYRETQIYRRLSVRHNKMVDISRHIDFLGPSGKTLSVSERSGLQVHLTTFFATGWDDYSALHGRRPCLDYCLHERYLKTILASTQYVFVGYLQFFT